MATGEQINFPISMMWLGIFIILVVVNLLRRSVLDCLGREGNGLGFFGNGKKRTEF